MLNGIFFQIRQNCSDLGGFQLLDLIIPELKSHVIPYKFKSSHWLKLQHSDWRANLVKDFFKNKFSITESTGYVIYNPAYTNSGIPKFQLKTT